MTIDLSRTTCNFIVKYYNPQWDGITPYTRKKHVFPGKAFNIVK